MNINLDEIPSLNSSMAIEFMDSDKELYLSILKLFVDEQSTAASLIENSLYKGDNRLAERIAHTVKANARIIGAYSLENAAMLLESAIKNNTPSALQKELLSDFARELDVIIKPVSKQFRLLQKPNVCKISDYATFTAVLQQLLRYIDTKDFLAASYLNDYELEIEELSTAKFKELKSYLSKFDFIAAREVLLSLVKTDEIKIEVDNRKGGNGSGNG